jgi:hypothetical protein
VRYGEGIKLLALDLVVWPTHRTWSWVGCFQPGQQGTARSKAGECWDRMNQDMLGWTRTCWDVPGCTRSKIGENSMYQYMRAYTRIYHNFGI